MQLLIDNPEASQEIADAVTPQGYFADRLHYNAAGNWDQNKPGAPSVVSIWGYLLGDDHMPRPDVMKIVHESSIFDLISVGLLKSGPKKLQVYYLGPKDRPIFRTAPYTDQAQTFDKLYPGHNEANFWDFFFPGMYEGWQHWIADPSSQPVADNVVTATAPYVDAITGNTIVSFFHPLWTKDRTGIDGMVGMDITLEQLADLIDSVRVAETGFAFITMSNGNVLAINPAGEKLLGLTTDSAGEGTGVTGMNRGLFDSTQPDIAALKLPSDDHTVLTHAVLDVDGTPQHYEIALRRLPAMNLWNADGSIGAENFTLAFVVPDNEIYATLTGAQKQIARATSNIVQWQTVSLVLCLTVVLAIAFVISGRVTAGLSQLSDAARRLQHKDYSVHVRVPTNDEVGEVGRAFNTMAEEIRQHTENLEHLVTQRTGELATANEKILKLNDQLKSENTRLGAELDVAQRVQSMVLPRPEELAAIPGLDIAACMNPADEVGGDYYDVLTSEGRVKIGIGDVAGHGLESGVLMLMVQSVARALLESGERDPKRFLEVLNRAIYKNVARTQSGKHMTLAYVDYDERGLTLTGQHEDVIIVRGDGGVEHIDTMDLGFPIGLDEEIGPLLDTHRFELSDGDVMLLYTDGITEAERSDGELFGFERLCESARRHSRAATSEAVMQGIIADVMAFIGGHKIHDDITLLVMRHT